MQGSTIDIKQLLHALPPTPLVSVIMTTFNSEATLESSVRSLLCQTYENIELIISDDGSTDATLDVAARLSAEDERVKVLRFGGNNGTYWAKNYGLTRCRGDVVTFADSDDTNDPRRIALQLEALRRPGVAVSTCLYDRVDEKGTRLPVPGSRGFAFISQMIRRDVLELIGFFDSVRTSADDEMLHRLLLVFGKNSHAVVREKLYTALVREGSLSHNRDNPKYSPVTKGLSPARRAYVDAFNVWHEETVTAGAIPFMPFPVVKRPFSVDPKLQVKRGPAGKGFITILAFGEGDHSDASLQELKRQCELVIGCRRTWHDGLESKDLGWQVVRAPDRRRALEFIQSESNVQPGYLLFFDLSQSVPEGAIQRSILRIEKGLSGNLPPRSDTACDPQAGPPSLHGEGGYISHADKKFPFLSSQNPEGGGLDGSGASSAAIALSSEGAKALEVPDFESESIGEISKHVRHSSKLDARSGSDAGVDSSRTRDARSNRTSAPLSPAVEAKGKRGQKSLKKRTEPNSATAEVAVQEMAPSRLTHDLASLIGQFGRLWSRSEQVIASCLAIGFLASIIGFSFQLGWLIELGGLGMLAGIGMAALLSTRRSRLLADASVKAESHQRLTGIRRGLISFKEAHLIRSRRSPEKEPSLRPAQASVAPEKKESARSTRAKASKGPVSLRRPPGKSKVENSNQTPSVNELNRDASSQITASTHQSVASDTNDRGDSQEIPADLVAVLRDFGLLPPAAVLARLEGLGLGHQGSDKEKAVVSALRAALLAQVGRLDLAEIELKQLEFMPGPWSSKLLLHAQALVRDPGTTEKAISSFAAQILKDTGESRG